MKSKSKSIVSKSVVVSKALVHGGGVTDPLPHADPPAPPEGFVVSRIGRGGARPQRVQLELALHSANELRASAEYAKQFGDSAPDKGEIADALTVARAWSDKLQKAADWHAYVVQQEHRAWKHALELLLQGGHHRPRHLGSEHPVQLPLQLDAHGRRDLGGRLREQP